jgi:hypothetical protein
MSPEFRSKSWLGRNKWYLIVGVPLLWFVLAPFSLFGCGMIYPIMDTLRGHPQGAHGSHPQKFAGLWIRDEYVEFDFLGQAFYLLPEGRFAGMMGMTERRWHFDDNCLFIDAVSRCGNCYAGNVTTEHTIRFDGADQLLVTNKDKNATRGIAGRYRRVEIDAALKKEMTQRAKSTDDEQSFKARMVLQAIDQFEHLSKRE